jgi:cyanophycinase
MEQQDQRRSGHLLIIGGAEDREGDMPILRRFIELAGRDERPILVLTAATEDPEKMWEVYRKGFAELDAGRVEHLPIRHRDEANDPGVSRRVFEARGVFVTGGDQARLLTLTGGTQLCEHMRRAYIENGTCIAGTSAGASAMSEHMLSSADSHTSPIATDVRLTAGLGFLLNGVVDQHFSERGRLGRLLAVVAHNPKLVGVGIDENTALVVSRGKGIEVIGQGAVTLVDGRELRSRVVERDDGDVFQVTDVRVHLLPAMAGFVQAQDEPDEELSDSLQALLRLLSGREAVDRQFREGGPPAEPTVQRADRTH